MHEISHSAIERVAPSFDRQTLERGLRYAMEGRVQLTRSAWPAVAQVRGSDAYVVTVHYNHASEHLRGDCSCPVGDDCKHAAAAALMVFQSQVESSDDQYREYKASAVGDWLSSLGRDASEGFDVAPYSGPLVLTYVLERFGGQLSLALYRTTRKKRGGYGKASKLNTWSNPTHRAPEWVSREDLRLMTTIIALGSSHYRSEYELGSFDEALFKELLATHRLFFDAVSDRPLRWGPPREQSLGWHESEEDSEEFCIGLGRGLVLVPALTNFYIDTEARVMGRLELGVPPPLAQRLVSGPAVPRFMRKTAETSLRTLIGDGLFAQVFGAGDEVDAGAPADPLVPCVQVEFVDIPEPQFEYSAQARYGSAVFPLGEWREQAPAEEDLVRNMAEEGRLAARLDELFGQTPYLSMVTGKAEVLRAVQFVAQKVLPTLRSEGWDIDLVEELPVPEPIVDVEFVEELQPVAQSRNFFSLGLGVFVSGRRVELLPLLLDAIKDGRINFGEGQFGQVQPMGLNLKLPTGELIYVPKERLDRWIRPLTELRLRGLNKDKALLMPGVAAADLAVGDSELFAGSAALEAIRDSLAQLVNLQERSEGKDFRGELRGYQRQGLGWLRFLHDHGYGGLLCDDMGLGKTVQLLAFADGLRAARKLSTDEPILVLAPRSVVGNWRNEAARFAPKLKCCVHLGGERSKTREGLRGHHLIVTSYQTLLRDIELFSEVPLTSLILDEAQALKTPGTKLRRAVASLRAHSRICVSGTPIENHLLELWSLIDIAMPGVFGSKNTFQVVFRTPIEKYGNDESLALLQRRLRPFMLRRRKADVDLDLPPKTVIVEKVGLDHNQRDLYESLRLVLRKEVQQALKTRGVQGVSLKVLEALLRLRQCCCDPRLLDVPEARKAKTSAKLERLMSMLDELADAERSVLVFSQFTSMLDLIARECDRLELPYVMLTGATRDRETVIESFQRGEVPIFLISLKAGGVGLNLTRADTVIHYDPWWNPAAENQATDRAHRIGQDKNVLVYKLVAEKTLEETICEMQAQKEQLTEATLREGGVQHLQREDLESLLRRL